MRLLRIVLVGAFLTTLCPTVAGGEAEATTSTAERICGTWVLQQVSGQEELNRLVPTTVSPALKTPHVRGFCLRVPWKAIDRDFSLLAAGRDIAQRHGVAFSVRFMAGRHTPEHVFDKGTPFYMVTVGRRTGGSAAEKVPAPFLPDGSPNTVFEDEYNQFVQRLASWCRENDVHLLHLAWYGQHWAELNHGKEVRVLEGYSFENWMRAHIRLLDIGLEYAGDDLAVELPFSGYGPLTEAACRFADHVVTRLGPHNGKFYCQANGWGPRGDWGAPSADTEAAFDKVWQKPICRGQQAIQPSDFPWSQLYEKLYQNRSTYCEVYAPSFLDKNHDVLAEEIGKFAEHWKQNLSPHPPSTDMPKPNPPGTPQAGRAPKLLDRPYVPLMTLMGGGPLGHTPSDKELATIAKTYQFVNSHGGMVQPGDPRRRVMAFWAGPSSGVDERGRTIGERIKTLSPGFTLSNYRNGSYVSQNCANEAAEVEAGFPLGIAVWNTGTSLQEAVSADDTSILVSSAREIPKGMPRVYPFKASTTQAEHSKSPHEYVAWLRLGDEIIRIDSVTVPASKTIRMEVRRGQWRTKATAHGIEERVLQPVYVGANRGIAAADGYLSGRPDTDAPQLGLRYALDQSDPGFHKWLGDKCAAIFSEGYDVAWLDVSVSTWYNNANAYGTPVIPWNVVANRPMDSATYLQRQQIKLDALFRRFPGQQFFVNNVKGNCYFDHGRERRLLSGDGGHHPASGGSMEMYANTRDERAWQQVADMTLDFVLSGFWGVAWSKGGGGSRYRQFAYGTFLLAYEPDSRLLFGAGFGGVSSRPDRVFYWNLGEPLQRFRRIDEGRHGEVEGVYCRDFTEGKVLVHPTSANAITVRLSREYYDPDSGRPVREVRLAPFTAKILLILPTD